MWRLSCLIGRASDSPTRREAEKPKPRWPPPHRPPMPETREASENSNCAPAGPQPYFREPGSLGSHHHLGVAAMIMNGCCRFLTTYT